MKQSISYKKRKELATRLATAFEENTRTLSREMQRILMDDMVTAFENRLSVLMQAQKLQKSDTKVGTIIDSDLRICSESS